MNLMLDIETTGTNAGCCILSVAMVPFGELATELDYFYEKISHTESKLAGFQDDPDTLRWWDKQSPEAQEEAFSGTRSPKSVLESLSFYLKGMGEPKELFIWGNGKDFDQPIMQFAFKNLGLPVPWRFQNNKCYRDLCSMYPMYTKTPVLGAHNALNDAVAQARHAEIILQGAKRGVLPVFPA